MNVNLDEYIWSEKYRPKCVDDCILSDDIKSKFKKMVEKKQIQNLLLSGDSGIGKTTVARALCEEIGVDYILINGSEDNGIDVLRSRIREFASSISLSGGIKVVIIDEADFLNPRSFQPAFRAFIEEFSSNCRFILTCNNKNMIINALQSRLTNYHMVIKDDDVPMVSTRLYKRIKSILKSESIEAKDEVIAHVINKYFPDFRKTIEFIQDNSITGVLSDKVLANNKELQLDELYAALKAKDWHLMRQWVADNVDGESEHIFRLVYDEFIDKTEQPHFLVDLISEYQYRSAFVRDYEINYVAFFTKVLADVDFR